MTDVFISYSGKDGEKIANAFKKGLPKFAVQSGLQKADMQVFVAHNAIRAGEDWEKEIWNNLRKCQWFFFVVTPESNKSPYAQQELGGAIMRKKTIIPVLGEGMRPEDLPGFIKNRQALSLVDGEHKIAEVINDIMNKKAARKRDTKKPAVRALSRSEKAKSSSTPDYVATAETKKKEKEKTATDAKEKAEAKAEKDKIFTPKNMIKFAGWMIRTIMMID